MQKQFVKPVAARGGTTRCSASDRVLSVCYPSLVLCYPERLSAARLREALELVLGDFEVFAGRMRQSGAGLIVDRAVGGALFEVADSAQTSTALCTAVRTQHSKLVCPRISPLSLLFGKPPLLAVRLTNTPDGCVLGVTWNHAIGDNRSAVALIQAWGNAYRGVAYEKPIDPADRDAYLAERLPAPLGAEPSPWRVLSWPRFLRHSYMNVRAGYPPQRIALELASADIAAIHAAASAERSITPKDALAAHLFLLIRRLAGPLVSSRFATAVDYRKRLGLPLNLLGNMIDMAAITASPHDDTGSVASALRAAIQGFGTGRLMQHDLVELMAAHPGRLERLRYWRSDMPPAQAHLHLSNVSDTGYQRLIFGSTSPSMFHVRAMDLLLPGQIVVLDNAAGGVTVETVLTRALTDRLLQADYRTPLQPAAGRTRSATVASALH